MLKWKLAGLENELAFNAALMGHQIKRIGEYSGGLDLHMIRNLHPEDYQILRMAQVKLNTVETDPKPVNDVNESGNTSY